MNCNEIRDLMSLYIDGELDATDQIQFEAHIASCEACKYEFEMLKEIIGTLNETEIAPLPDNFHEDLMGKIHVIKQESEAKPNKITSFLSQLFTKKFMVPAMSIACIMLVLIVAKNPLIMNDGLVMEKSDKSENKMAYDTAVKEEAAKEAPAETKSQPMVASESTNSINDVQKEEANTDNEVADIEEMQVAGEVELTLTYGDDDSSQKLTQTSDGDYELIDTFLTYEEILTYIVNDLNEVKATHIQLIALDELKLKLDEVTLMDSLRIKFEHIKFYSSSEKPKENYYTIVGSQVGIDSNVIFFQVLNESDFYKEYHVEIQESGLVLRQTTEDE